MYKGLVNKSTTVDADTNIAFTTTLNTNGNTTPNTVNNYVAINNTGYYDFSAVLTLTDVSATPVTASLLANGVVIGVASSDVTVGTGTITLPIRDVERVVLAPSTQKVQIAVQVNENATIDEGSVLIIEKVR